MYLEKYKQESEKIRTLCGFAWILLMEIYLPENVAVLPGMERTENMYLLYYIIIMKYEVRVGNNKTCTSNPQQWGRKGSKRKKNSSAR